MNNPGTKVTILFLILLSLVCIGCNETNSNDQSSQETLARVGEEYLSINEASKSIPDFILKEDSISAMRRFRDEWIKKQVLLQEADRLDLSQKEEVKKKLKETREEVLREALKTYILGSEQDNLQVSDQEARNYYQENKEQFALKERYVKFRHLKTTSFPEARAAKQALLDGTPWPEVAKQYSIDSEKVITKSEQFWPLSMAANNIQVMNRYLNVIGQDEISPIQRSEGVYHFVQLTDSRAKGEQPDLEWLIKQIKDWLELNKQRRHFSSYTKNLYLKAKSNNEVETYDVLSSESNQKSTLEDTLENNQHNE